MIAKKVILKLAQLITAFSEFLPLLFCIFFFKRLNTRALKVFFIYAIFKFLLTLGSIISIYLFHSRPSFLLIFKFDLISEYLILTYFFWLLIRSRIVRHLLVASTVPFVFYSLWVFSTSPNTTFNNSPTLVELLVFIVVIIYYLFEQMRISFQMPVYQTISFWLSVGLFVYFSGIFFYILLVESYFRQSDRIKNELILISSTVLILKNIILALAFTVKESKAEDSNYEFNIPLEINLDSFTPYNNLN